MGRVPSPSPPCRSGGGDVVLVPHTLAAFPWPPAGKRRQRKGGKRTRGVGRQVYSGGKLSISMIRSYDPEYTPSRPIWEVKQDSARPVLRTEMTREALVTNLLPLFCPMRLCRRVCARNRREKRPNERVLRRDASVGRGHRRRAGGTRVPGSNRTLESVSIHHLFGQMPP